LGVILNSYTVYVDLWVADGDGKVLANGRPRDYSVRGMDVSGEEWFRKALQLRSGTEFVACDISCSRVLNKTPVATYSTAIREGGRAEGRVTGVLGIFFDWGKQSQIVVDTVRLTPEERPRTRCLIVNGGNKVIASSERTRVFDTFQIEASGERIGSYVDGRGNLIGFALTPGYETYKGLGWYGVIAQHRQA
jgi:hypothetical protein